MIYPSSIASIVAILLSCLFAVGGYTFSVKARRMSL